MASPARPEPGRQPRDMLRVAICGGTGPERTALLDLLRRGAGKSLADHPDTNGDRFAGIAVGQPEPTGLTWHYFETFERKGLSPWPRRHKMLCRRPRGRVPGSVAQNAPARPQGGPGGGDFRVAGAWTDCGSGVPAPGPRQARPSTMS